LVYNLADNLNTFGLAPNSTNTYAVVYKTFGTIAKNMYPELFGGDLEPVDDILDLSYLRNIMTKEGSNITSAATESYASGEISQVVAKRDYTIEFATGKADLTPAGEATLQGIYESLIVANGLKVEVDGYTDNTGSEGVNQALSESRAAAVKLWLQAKSSANFPNSRISVKGFGSGNPVASNDTEYGRSKNRRVVIKMGN
jgi:OOP family OmpA-OmpF porin